MSVPGIEPWSLGYKKDNKRTQEANLEAVEATEAKKKTRNAKKGNSFVQTGI